MFHVGRLVKTNQNYKNKLKENNMTENNSKSVTPTDDNSKVRKKNQQIPEKKVSDIKVKKQAEKINIVKVDKPVFKRRKN